MTAPASPCDVVLTVTDRISTIFLVPLATELHRRGHRVGLATNLHGAPPPPELDQVLAWHRDIPMHRSPAPVADAADLARLTRLFRQVRPAVVHASTPKAGLLGVVAARTARVGHVVYQVRGLRGEHATGLSGRLQRASESVALRAADTVVFNSPSMLAAARRSGLPVPAGALVVGAGSSIGVDTARFAGVTPRPPGSTPTIGFIGRLHTDKGAADLLAVRDRLAGRFGEVAVVVAGGADPTDPASVDLAVQLAARPGVTMLGHVDDIAGVLGAIDVLVFPSVREGLPNAPLEAQAAGVPVVAYAATGTVDAVADGVGGRLVAVGDTAALADAAGELLGDGALRHSMGAAGRAFVAERFERADVVAAHVDLIERCIARPRR